MTGGALKNESNKTSLTGVPCRSRGALWYVGEGDGSDLKLTYGGESEGSDLKLSYGQLSEATHMAAAVVEGLGARRAVVILPKVRSEGH